MDYSRNKQNNIIGNIYLYQANKALLSEQEQQQAKQQIQINQLAAGIRQSGVAAKVEAKIKELAQDKNFLTQLEDAKKKNQLEQFLMAIANQITVSAGQPTVNTVNTQKNESYELNEALPSRLGSLASAARDRLMGDKPTSNLPLRVQAILKHFEKLKINVGSHLRELQRDMETTSNVDVKVKNLVNQFVADLGDTTAMHGGIAPTQSKLGDIRHAAGRLVGFGAAATTIAAAVAPLGAAVAGIAGLKGLGAVAASSALKGGVFKSLHSLATGQGIPKATEVAKIMAVSALGGAAGAKIGSMLHDLATKPIEAITNPTVGDLPPQSTDPMYSDVNPSVDSPEQLSRDFSNLQGGPLNPKADVDQIKAHTSRLLRMKGIMGAMSSGERVPSPAVQNVIDNWADSPSTRQLALDVANKLSTVSDQDLKTLLSPEVRKAGSGAVSNALKSLLKM